MKTRASSMMEGAVCAICAICARCVLAGAWVLAAAPRAQTQATQGEAQKPTTADVSLGQALHQEQNEGRLEDAIATYRKVLAAVDVTRAQKARAQFRIGACYERLGLSEARKAYEIVVSEYGDQNEFAAQARARLGAISALATGAAPQKTPGGPTTRLLWSKPGWTSADLSPDGRSVAFIDEASMCLWIRDIATGADRQLTTTTKDEPWNYASYAIWSPDASRIAYSWYKLDGASGTAEIRVVDLKSGAIATFPRSRAATSAEPSDWSPDGRRVLVVVGSEKLAWLNTADGMVSPLAGIRAPQLRAARLSPDGLTIVFGAAAGDGRTDGDIFIGPADGSTTSVLLGGPGDEYPVAWTPDGARLLVRGQRSGSSGFWLLRVEKGKAVGDPEFLPGVGTARFQGLSRAGAMLYSTGVSQTDLRVAVIDLRTGHTGPPDVLGVLPGSVPAAMGGWSKDGAHLAYLATVGERIIVVV
ncbi:MAG: tetratricopeptide repeat protein, partial [Acidobacteria bacterium]|nr:tetratricopeptide repeat protein [Acidobacteriota bacterium]